MSGRPRGRQYRDRRSFSSSGSERAGPGGGRGSRGRGPPQKRPIRRRLSRSLSPMLQSSKIPHRSRSPHRDLSPRNRIMSRSPKPRSMGYSKKRSLSPMDSQHSPPLLKSQRPHNTDSFRYGGNRKSPPPFASKKQYAPAMGKAAQSSKYKEYKYESREPSGNRERSYSGRRQGIESIGGRHRSPYSKDSFDGSIGHKTYESEREGYRKKDRSLSPRYYREPSIPKRETSKPSFSRADLEKITIDIRRNVKDPSPTRRAIQDPADIKVVRRNNEGSRAIFDREEIRNPTVDKREDALMERRVVTVKPSDREMGGALRAENRSRDIFSDTQMTLSQRWQATSFDERKPTQRVISQNAGYPKEFRERSSDKSSRLHSESNLMSRESHYRDGSPGRFIDNPDDLRHNLGSRKEPYGDYKRKPYEDGGSRSLPLTESRVPQREGRSGYTSSSGYRQQSGGETSPLPDFSQRPDRYKYTEWLDKPEVIPKGSSYFEVSQSAAKKLHDDRSKPFLRMRGRGRPFRGPRGASSNSANFERTGSRGGFRGFATPRGGRMGQRGPYRGVRGQQRGARGNYNRSGSKSSPNLWEHDLYNKSPSEKGNKSP